MDDDMRLHRWRALVLVGTLFLGWTAAHGQLPTISPDPPRRASLCLATGEVAVPVASRSIPLVQTWANTDWSGFHTPCGAGPVDEYLDWGILSTSSGSDIVGKVTIGYGTTALDPAAGGPGASLTLRIYPGGLGLGQDGGLPPAAEFVLTGLPGSSDGVAPAHWVLDLDLVGGSEFRLPQGPFAYSVTGTDDDGFGQSRTGPMLCFAGDGAGGADANGQVNFFDLWYPDLDGTYNGTYSFGVAPSDFASWYFEVWTLDAVAGGITASVVTRNDAGQTNAAVFSCTPPVLGSSFTGSVPLDGHSWAAFGAYRAPLEFPFTHGVLLVDLLHPAGELLGLMPVAADPATFAVPVPLDLTLLGFGFSAQAVRYGGGISLTNACDAVIGL